MNTDTRRSWVAFDANGFPFGFAIHPDGCADMAEAAKEFPTAHRIEMLDTAEWKAQMNIHRGVAP